MPRAMHIIAAIVLSASMAPCLAACDTPTQEDVDNASQRIEEAASKAEEALDEAAGKAEEALDEAAKKAPEFADRILDAAGELKGQLGK